MHAARIQRDQGTLAPSPLRAAPAHPPAPAGPAKTRAQLHRDLRDSANAIPVPLHPQEPKPAEQVDQPTPQMDTDGKALATVSAPAHQVLREPTIPELMWLEEMRIHLRHPADPALDQVELSTHFDEFCQAWHASPTSSRWDSTYAVNSLGVALGDLLIARLDQAHWVIYESNERTFFAVRDNQHRVTFLPLDAVARRWLNQQFDWIPAFVEQAVDPQALSPAE